MPFWGPLNLGGGETAACTAAGTRKTEAIVNRNMTRSINQTLVCLKK